MLNLIRFILTDDSTGGGQAAPPGVSLLSYTTGMVGEEDLCFGALQAHISVSHNKNQPSLLPLCTGDTREDPWALLVPAALSHGPDTQCPLCSLGGF